MKTIDKLVNDLIQANAPFEMIAKARTGYYDDYRSPLATPVMHLVNDARQNGLLGITQRAMDGEYDGTKEEAEEWFNRIGKDYLSGELK
jgi:hypothetical protein